MRRSIWTTSEKPKKEKKTKKKDPFFMLTKIDYDSSGSSNHGAGEAKEETVPPSASVR
jgi:hypothetical protein